MQDAPRIDIRRARERYHTDFGWLDSRHSFSFGGHFDPANTGHGLLIVSNDDRVAPGGGFGSHPHRDMEIVSWVVEGRMRHKDSAGHEGVIYPGLAQRMSAGRGIVHSEMNKSEHEPLHFVQMWVVPDTPGVDPGYEQRDVNEMLDAGGLVPVASGKDHPGAIHIHQAGAVMWVARPSAGDVVEIPDAAYVHLFVVRGSGRIGDESLDEGDAVRLTDAGTISFTAHDACELIVWESDAQAVR